MKTRMTSLISIGLAVVVTSAVATADTVTQFSAELLPGNVLQGSEVSTGAFGEATLTLTQPVSGNPELDFTLRLFNVNADSLTAFTSGDFPNTSATDVNMAAIHFHTVADDGSNPRGTEHVLNVFGPPLTSLNLPAARPFIHPVEFAEDDYVPSFESSSGAAIVTGRWDLTDVAANDVGGEDGIGNFGESKSLADFVDQLKGEPTAGNQRVFIMIHTSAFTNGEFGGFVRRIPEPTTIGLFSIAASSLLCLRRRKKATELQPRSFP
ncbi:MAG: PEP-CTERM sorting domain-containing protein [Pirellulales bacterium]|nr:PEP-CTERM sorting domain-containing protein [Pirellulales bacterium]